MSKVYLAIYILAAVLGAAGGAHVGFKMLAFGIVGIITLLLEIFVALRFYVSISAVFYPYMAPSIAMILVLGFMTIGFILLAIKVSKAITSSVEGITEEGNRALGAILGVIVGIIVVSLYSNWR